MLLNKSWIQRFCVLVQLRRRGSCLKGYSGDLATLNPQFCLDFVPLICLTCFLFTLLTHVNHNTAWSHTEFMYFSQRVCFITLCACVVFEGWGSECVARTSFVSSKSPLLDVGFCSYCFFNVTGGRAGGAQTFFGLQAPETPLPLLASVLSSHLFSYLV